MCRRQKCNVPSAETKSAPRVHRLREPRYSFGNPYNPRLVAMKIPDLRLDIDQQCVHRCVHAP